VLGNFVLTKAATVLYFFRFFEPTAPLTNNASMDMLLSAASFGAEGIIIMVPW
jgi:hypothetical protein